MSNPGDVFQKETKYSREDMRGGHLDWSTKPELYKVYETEEIDLELSEVPSLELDETLKKRKSIRKFSDTKITLDQLSYLLWACTGIQREENGFEFRTAPSAGALYPLETYLITKRVEELEKGLYHYNIKDHKLEVLRKGDFSREITSAALGQRVCSQCAVVFVWTAVFYRSKWKYKQRAYRYVYLDAGHIAQNLALAAVGLGLGSCQVGAFYDDEVNTLIEVDGTAESTVYLSVVGNPEQ